MPLHTAYGLPLEELDIVAIDDSKAMQGIYRSIFSSFRTKRARVYGDPERAMNAMLLEPPNVLLLDWRMESTSGAKLLRTLRLKQMYPLCFLPVIVISAF
ncbi:MAG: response regulator, partial [Hyphomicrobiales bacterium]